MNMKFCSFCILTLVLQLKVQGFSIVTNANAPDWVSINGEPMKINTYQPFGFGDGVWVSGGGIDGLNLVTAPHDVYNNLWTLEVTGITLGTGTDAIVSYLGEKVNLQLTPTYSFIAPNMNQSRVLSYGSSPVLLTQSQFYITAGTHSYYNEPYRATWGWGLFEIDNSGELTLLDSYSVSDTRPVGYDIPIYSERLDGIVTGEESFLIVPEPQTYALLLGVTVLGYVFSRRRK